MAESEQLRMARDISGLIRNVILAERERCAKVAEETGKAYCHDHFVMMGPAGIAHKIAHAIRQDNPNET